jgi:PqqD family protein of HPr-rel-A system
MVRADDNRWRVMRPKLLHVRRWENEVVLYDDRSGDTHILEDLAGRVLERLIGASAGIDELTKELLGSSACQSDDPALLQHNVSLMRNVLERLRRKGIVKPVRK